MAVKVKKNNQLLLLTGTAFVLCVAVLSSGNNSLSNSLQGMVLSDKDEVEEVKQEENKKVEERNKEANEKVREEEKKRVEQKAEESKKNIERVREEEKKRLEIKIREVKSSPEPLRDRNKSGEETREQKSQDDDSNSENEVEVEKENEYEIETEGVKATTDHPLKLNTKTNELSVTSKDGEVVKVVVLPDQAVENLSSNKKIEIVGETTLEENEETGKFEYKAKVVESKKLLGLFSIKLNKEYRVSSEDGEVEEVELTGINRLLNLISF